MNSNAIDYYRMTIPEKYGDCRFFCFRILLSYYGFYPSEEDMLVIGEGLSFSLVNTSPLSTKIFCPIGRTMCLEKMYGERAGIGITVNYFENNCVDDMIDKVKQKIDAGDPIVVNVDRYYLEYLSIQRAHMGYHTILIFGYDDEKHLFFLFDGLMGSKVVELSYRDFHKAVLSDCTIATEKMWYSVEGCQHIPNKEIKERTVALAIRNTCKRVISEIEFTHSVVGVLKRSFIDGDISNPQIIKFLVIQSNVFFQSFIEQDCYRYFYRKTFLAFLNRYIELFPKSHQKRITESGNDLIKSIQEVHNAWKQDAGRALVAFDVFIEKEEAMHYLLLDALQSSFHSDCLH